MNEHKWIQTRSFYKWTNTKKKKSLVYFLCSTVFSVQCKQTNTNKFVFVIQEEKIITIFVISIILKFAISLLYVVKLKQDVALKTTVRRVKTSKIKYILFTCLMALVARSPFWRPLRCGSVGEYPSTTSESGVHRMGSCNKKQGGDFEFILFHCKWVIGSWVIYNI